MNFERPRQWQRYLSQAPRFSERPNRAQELQTCSGLGCSLSESPSWRENSRQQGTLGRRARSLAIFPTFELARARNEEGVPRRALAPSRRPSASVMGSAPSTIGVNTRYLGTKTRGVPPALRTPEFFDSRQASFAFCGPFSGPLSGLLEDSLQAFTRLLDYRCLNTLLDSSNSKHRHRLGARCELQAVGLGSP